ncbi:MAG: chromosomal replication initiator protein DnaA [Bacilli bacterium]|nr:chromosomal replication initiator protein DnaA [Bacilli bacterium]
MKSDHLNTIWNEFLNRLEKEIEPILFELYFKDTKLIDLEDNKAKVLVDSIPIKKRLTSQDYTNLIEEIFNDVSGSNFKFEFLTEEEITTNISIDTDKFGVPSDAIFETNLNPEYTFDNYVVGNIKSKSARAKTMALSVAEKPGQMWNPLYIYGSSGLGKTHLMHAIGNYITANSNKRVLYVTSDKFVTDFMQLYKQKKEDNDNFNENVSSFKKKYRDLDVLIIDDIQYLETVGKLQQEFFNTFNELHDNHKQIILASDRSPDDLKKLEDRIRTRFTWGYILNVYPPDFDVRMDIIDKKIENYDLNIKYPKDVKEYIASNFTSNVRILENAIKRVFAYATMAGGADITYDLAVEALKDILSSNTIAKNKVDFLQQIICDNYNITIEDLKGNKRNREISIPRQIAMYIARVHINESYPKIATEFGGKNHTSVMHAVNKISKEIKTNKELSKEIDKIVSKLNV